MPTLPGLGIPNFFKGVILIAQAEAVFYYSMSRNVLMQGTSLKL